jgi:X-Pro dipeptidyl-peptidase
MNRTVTLHLLMAAAVSSCSLHLFAQAQPATGPVDMSAVPVFADGQAQIVPGFNVPAAYIKQGLWVETEFDSDKDGKKDRMHVDVTRPPQTDNGLKLPVIYETSPYFAGTRNSTLWNVEQELGQPSPARPKAAPFGAGAPAGGGGGGRGGRGGGSANSISTSLISQWVPRGFIVVHSSAPGTGLSQGIVTVGDDPEVLAPKAIIDWLNGRAKGYTTPDGAEEVKATWATGKVGMTGTSYNGTTPTAAACTGVDGLEVIIPVAPNTSYYHYYRSNGLVRSPGGWLGEDIDYLFDFINSGKQGQVAIDMMRDDLFAKNQDRVSGDYNEFWASRDLLPRAKNIKCAVLMAHAFNDWNVVPEHSVRIYQAIKDRVPSMIYMHQGGHGGNPPMEMMNKWFTKYLFGQDNGVEKGPRAWIVREGAPQGNPTPYSDYPNPDASPVALHPSADGLKIGNLGTAALPGQPKETLVDDFSFNGTRLAGGESNHRLLFATPVLSEPVHISGTARMTIKLASSKPAANLSVWLVVLPQTAPAAAGGGRGGRGPGSLTNTLITRGWADPQNYKSLTRDAPMDYHSMTKGEPLVPGQFYELTFPLQPDDQIIPAGKQIGLMILSSDPEFTLHPTPGTELTVDLDGTMLQLPVVGGARAFEQAVKPK